MTAVYPTAVVVATVTANDWQGNFKLKVLDASGSPLQAWPLDKFSDFYNRSESFPPGLDFVGPILNSVGLGYKGAAAWKGSAGEGGWSAEVGQLTL